MLYLNSRTGAISDIQEAALREIADPTKPAGDEYGLQMLQAMVELVSMGLASRTDSGLTLTAAGALGAMKNGIRISHLAKVHEHPRAEGFYEHSGVLDVGVDAAGDVQSWELWNNRGARHSLVVGTSGSGATNVLLGVIRASGGSRHVRNWVVANHGYTLNGSPIEEAERVVCASGDVVNLLARVLRVIEERRQILASQGSAGWSGPQSGMPFGLLTIADLDLVMRTCPERLAFIARAGRKVGVGLLIRSYDAMAMTFGGPQVRGHLIDGNILLLRAGKGVQTAALDPAGLLPDIPRGVAAGVGFANAQMPMRAYWVND